jgi:hypothetical protein
MIEHQVHEQIDKAAWDARCNACPQAAWYGLKATLDAASPGWNALVDTDTGEQMPLTWKRKWGIQYLHQPFMVQHAGPWSPKPSLKMVERFLLAIPGFYKYADICLDAPGLPTVPGFRMEQRRNHVLRLGRPLAEVRAGYSANHRRSLRKAEKFGVLPVPAGAGEVLHFLESSERYKEWGVTGEQRACMRRLLASSVADGTGVGRVVKHGGATVAAAWFVRSLGTVTFLKGVAGREGRELCALHALIDGMVAESAGELQQLDLAGGQGDDLARFYSGFGGEARLYLRALMNRLPPLVRRLKARA